MIGLFYELLYVVTFSALTASVLTPLLSWEAPLPVVLLCYVFLSAACVIFKKSRWLVRLVMLGTLLGIGLVFLFASRNEAFREAFSAYQLYLWIIPFSLICFLLGELMAAFRIVRLIISLLLVAGLVFVMVSDVDIAKVGPAFAFELLMLTAVQEVQRTWKKEGDTDSKKHLVWISPFLLAILLMISMLPVSDEPYDWMFIRKTVSFVQSTVDDIKVRWSLFNSTDGISSSMGFSGRGSLPGLLDSDDEEVLRLYNLPRETARLNVAGKTFNEFDGQEWFDQDSSEYADYMLDTLQLIAAVSGYSALETDYIRKAEVNIEYLRTNTRNVFLPLKSDLSMGNLSRLSYHMSSGDVLFDKKRGYKTDYKMSYYRMNTGNSAFSEFLREAEIPDEDTWKKILGKKLLSGNENLSYEAFLEHYDHIYEVYGEKVELSPKLRAIMDELYEGAEDDLEKLQRLEKLLSGMTYTNEPGDIPDDISSASEFLDYFMLETQKGYCSHFATAFVLLARAEGIPARFVQGYSVVLHNDSSLNVNASNAHAWPEVYLDNAGWIIYEPTPGFKKYTYWLTREESDSKRDPGAYSMENFEIDEIPDVLPDTEEDSSLEPVSSKTRTLHIRWYYLVLPVGGAVVFLLLFLFVGNAVSGFRYRRLDKISRIKVICKKNLRLMELLGFGREEAETLQEYQDRISSEFPEAPVRYLRIYEQVLYYRVKNPGWSLSDVEQDNRTLKRLLLRKNKRRYLRYRLSLQ